MRISDWSSDVCSTDTERLILVSPELAEVLSAVVQRSRQPNGSIPLVAAYDTQEKLWNPPMPLLFQRGIGNERRAIPPSFVRKLLITAITVAALTARPEERRVGKEWLRTRR